MKFITKLIFNKELLKVEPLVIVVSGNSNIGKSTFIRFSLQNLIAKHDSNRPGKFFFSLLRYTTTTKLTCFFFQLDLQCHHTKILLDDINCPIDIIELNGSIINEQTLPIIHAGLICYDTSTHDSFDSAAIDLSSNLLIYSPYFIYIYIYLYLYINNRLLFISSNPCFFRWT